jgi:Zn-dependent protease
VIGRITGAPVIISPSWFLAAGILTLLFAQTMSLVAPGPRAYAISFAFVLLLFVSVFCHEVAHAVVARRRGHQVTELALTLWGGHTSYTGGATRPLDGFLVAVVGPLTNIVLAGGFWALYRAQDQVSTVGLLLYAAAAASAFVGLFNLLPGLPLDGGQILESLVWALTGSRDRGTIAAAWVGRVVAVGVLVWALWPVFARGEQLELGTVVWSVLIGGFLWSGAGQALRSGQTRLALAGVRVRDLAVPVTLVPVTASVAAAGDAAAPGTVVALVNEAGRPVAVVDADAAASVPAQVADTTPVTAVATRIAPVPIDLDLSGQPLLTALSGVGNETPWVIVTHEATVVGALEIRRLIATLQAATGTGSRRS